jgi:hypothetical protein
VFDLIRELGAQCVTVMLKVLAWILRQKLVGPLDVPSERRTKRQRKKLSKRALPRTMPVVNVASGKKKPTKLADRQNVRPDEPTVVLLARSKRIVWLLKLILLEKQSVLNVAGCAKRLLLLLLRRPLPLPLKKRRQTHAVLHGMIAASLAKVASWRMRKHARSGVKLGVLLVLPRKRNLVVDGQRLQMSMSTHQDPKTVRSGQLGHILALRPG